jgi:hypothetical protein
MMMKEYDDNSGHSLLMWNIPLVSPQILCGCNYYLLCTPELAKVKKYKIIQFQ